MNSNLVLVKMAEVPITPQSEPSVLHAQEWWSPSHQDGSTLILYERRVVCVCIMLCQIVSCVYICVMHVNAYIVNQAYITVHYQYSMQCTPRAESHRK